MSSETDLHYAVKKLCPVLREKFICHGSSAKKSGFFSQSVNKLKDFFGVKTPIIVKLNPENQIRTLNNDNLGGVLGCQVKYRLTSIDGFSTNVSRAQLKRLIEHNAVAKVWYDRKVKAVLNVAARAANAVPVWRSRLQGKGIGIAILDTGIYPHPDLTHPRNRIIAFKDFVNGRSRSYDDNGHGTHCAGCAAGNGYRSKKKYRGIAPNANLISVKILDRRGSGRISTVLAGIEWCMANRKTYRIKVISISFGALAIESYRDDPLCAAVEKAWTKGIVVCAAAGNEGPKPGTVNTPGIDPRIITVGALDDHNTSAVEDDTIAGFSSRGPTIDGLIKPDLLSPGVKIISLRSPGSYLDRFNSQARVGQSYFSSSGTSMATPICSGAAALILQAYPGLAPAEVKKALMAACRNMKMDVNAQGAGLLDIKTAVKFLE